MELSIAQAYYLYTCMSHQVKALFTHFHMYTKSGGHCIITLNGNGFMPNQSSLLIEGPDQTYINTRCSLVCKVLIKSMRTVKIYLYMFEVHD